MQGIVSPPFCSRCNRIISLCYNGMNEAWFKGLQICAVKSILNLPQAVFDNRLKGANFL
jgi:hypothetical protein